MTEPDDAWPVVYLRCVDPGTDSECWVICAKGDPGAYAFVRARCRQLSPSQSIFAMAAAMAAT